MSLSRRHLHRNPRWRPAHPAGDIPPTGRRVTAGYIEVHRFRDGKSIYATLMYDQLEMLEQLGLMPAPAPAG
jgi:hypothetical protein